MSEIEVGDRDKTRISGELAIFGHRAEGRKGAREAEVAKKKAFKSGRIGGYGPAGDSGPASWYESAVHFGKKCLLVRHVRKGLNSEAVVEAVPREVVLEPVAILDPKGAADGRWFGLGPGGLREGDRKACDASVVLFSDPAGIGSVSTSDVNESAAGSGFKWSKEEFEETGSASCHGMVMGGIPEAMMEACAPEGAVEPVQPIVMSADISGSYGTGGTEHAERKRIGFRPGSAGSDSVRE